MNIPDHFGRCRIHGQGNGTWAHQAGVKLNFIRPGKAVENGYVESFNGRLRDEYLNAEIFLDLADARRKFGTCRNDYNQRRPHSALADRTPDEFASMAKQLLCSVPRRNGGSRIQLRECLKKGVGSDLPGSNPASVSKSGDT